MWEKGEIAPPVAIEEQIKQMQSNLADKLKNNPDQDGYVIRLGKRWLDRITKKWNLKFLRGAQQTAYELPLVMSEMSESLIKSQTCLKLLVIRSFALKYDQPTIQNLRC